MVSPAKLTQDGGAGAARAACTTGKLSFKAWLATSELNNRRKSSSAAKLAKLTQNIATLNTELNRDLLERDSVVRELRHREQAVGKAVSVLRTVAQQLTVKRKSLADLLRERIARRAQLEEHREVLAAQIRAAYALGRKDQLQMLLNQDDPSLYARTLAYHGYFARARVEQVSDLRTNLERLAEVHTRIDTEAATLEQLHDEQARQLAELERERLARGILVKTLSARIVTGEQRLKRLREDEQKLTQLLKRITSEFETIQTTVADLEPFAEQRARLSWPVNGKVQHRFGTTREDGGLTWQGMLFSAPPGQPVHAVFHGRVAFAEWLGGFY